MPIKQYELDALSMPRVHPHSRPAAQQLRVAHTTLQGIFDSLHVVRSATRTATGDGRGRLKEGEIDLLRSAIVLAGAGMEAVLKRLVADALPPLLGQPGRSPQATRAFRTYVSGQLREKGTPTSWVDAIVSDDPRPQMIRLYVTSMVSGSIQSERELKVVRDALGIDEQMVTDDRIASLSGFLTARNQVAHDLDLRKPHDESRGQRYQRTIPKVLEQCNEVIDLAATYVTGVSSLFRGRPAASGRPQRA